MTVKVVKSPQAKGYSDAGASHTKRALKGFIAVSGAPSEDIDVNNMTMRQRGRMLYMASPVAAAAINTNRTKIVGSGLRMKCAVNNDILGLSDEEVRRWQRNTEAEWRMWAERRSNCDTLGVNNFYELEQLAVKSWLMSGDAFVLLKRTEATPLNPYTLRLHIIEADRVSTPFCERTAMFNQTEGKTASGNKIYDGVEIDSSGRVLAYHVCNLYPYQNTAEERKWQRIEVEGKSTGIPNILHLMDAERPDQYRGVTYLASVIETLLQLRRYTESELVAALVQSYLTAWIVTESDPTDFPLNEVGAGDVDGIPGTQPDSVSDNENEYEMGPGQINHLKKGENVVFGNPNIPTAGYDAFVRSITKMAGAALELPYDVLIKEFNSSYSAAKGALEETWEMIKMRRAWFINDFCQPVDEVWLAEAVATGRIKAPGFWENPLVRAAWCGARWDGPAQTHLDPVKEAKANELVVQHGWKTNEQITREYYGSDWSENAAVISQEQQRLNSVTPDNQI
ncbi:MAG: phage portal protein [Oscillospiraceae bacterium]|nr:phage portal protein [Oscillospiraceae bacterium]